AATGAATGSGVVIGRATGAAEPAACVRDPTSGTMSAATATASTAIIIALLITALFIFIFYPSPKVIWETEFLTITISGECRIWLSNLSYFRIHNFGAKGTELTLLTGISIKP